MIIRAAQSGITVRSSRRSRGLWRIDLGESRETIISAASEVESVAQDANIRTHYDAVVDRVSDVIVVAESTDGLDGVSLETTDATVAVVDALGRLTRVSNGTVQVRGHNRAGQPAISSPINVVRTPNTQAVTFLSWIEGTLARSMTDALDAAIQSRTAAHVPIFTDLSRGERNPVCWTTLAGYDVSCVSLTNPTTTLIAPQYALQAAHYPDNGITWMAMDGSRHERTVTAAVGLYGDIRVIKLSAPVPVAAAMLPPEDLEEYLPNVGYRIPCLSLDQEKKALVGDLISLSESAIFRRPTDLQRLAFYEDKVSGDSGSPAFCLLPGGGLLLVTAWTWGGAGSGPDYGDWLDEMNSWVVGQGSAQIMPADLSAYPKWS